MKRRNKSPVIGGLLLAGFVLLGCCCGPCSFLLQPSRDAADSTVLTSAVPSSNTSPQANDQQTSVTQQPPLPLRSKTSTRANALPNQGAASLPAQPLVAPPPPEVLHVTAPAMREWTSGQYKTNAAFLSLKDGVVKLQKQPGGTADVPLDRLAPADRDFVKQQIRINVAESVMVAQVTAVVDGDTITVIDEDKREHKVKLKGIDAPELGQVYGDRAKQALETLLLGKTPWIESHEIDHEGFVRGKVYLDGLSINLHMLGEGQAWHVKADESSVRYRNAELVARTNRVGLWINESPAPPWEYRKHKARTGR